MKHSFRNDYNTIGHPDILQVLVNNAKVVNVGYGFDEETKKFQYQPGAAKQAYGKNSARIRS